MFYNLKDKKLKNSNKSWVAPNVTTIGGAILEKNSNIWFNSVLREDIENINIGVKVLITVNKKILDNSNLKIISANDLNDAAKKIVEAIK